MIDEPLRRVARKYRECPAGRALIKIVDKVLNTGRACSVWPLGFGLACCAIEMMATAASRYDLDRFGMLLRPSPRQADLMIVAGTVTMKMAPVIEQLYHQMPEPKYVLALGNCAISGGRFYRDAYSVVRGVDRILPVDVYVPGCPPRPEGLVNGLLDIHDIIRRDSLADGPYVEGRRPEYRQYPRLEDD